jgi:hypothetical protein
LGGGAGGCFCKNALENELRHGLGRKVSKKGVPFRSFLCPVCVPNRSRGTGLVSQG